MAYFALNSLSVGTESTLIGSTTVPADAKRSKSSVKAHIFRRAGARERQRKERQQDVLLPPEFAERHLASRRRRQGKLGRGRPDFRFRGRVGHSGNSWVQEPWATGGVGRLMAFEPRVHLSHSTRFAPSLGVTTGMPHTLPALPYDFAALEPHIDAQTMQIHHGKHHQAYVNNLNAALDKHPELHTKTLDDLLKGIASVPEDIRTAVRNNAGGHHNHSLFWTVMGPKAGGSPAAPWPTPSRRRSATSHSSQRASRQPPRDASAVGGPG